MRAQWWYVVIIALILGAGAGLFTSTYSLLSVLSGDPIPNKSERLLSINVGPYANDNQLRMSSVRAQALREALPGLPLVATGYGVGSVEDDTGGRREQGFVRFADARFFRMFDVPMLEGRSWTAEEAEQNAPVAVIGRSFALSLFGTIEATGRSILIGESAFRVIGVLDEWHPAPRFYDLAVGAYAPADQVYLPLSAVGMMDDDFFVARVCLLGGDAPPRRLENSPCGWLTAWVLVDGAGQRRRVKSATDAILAQLKLDGADPFARISEATVESVPELLQRSGTVPAGAKFGVLLGASFLLLCLVNAAGLLLAKCLRRSQEIGVRRALGASQRDIMQQFMVESVMLGIASSAIAIGFTAVGVSHVRKLPRYYVQFVEFDLSVLAFAVATSMAVAIAAGLLPAWRASRVDPAIQVKID